MLLPSALGRVLALIVASRDIWPVTAPTDLMAGALGASRPRVSPGFLSLMGPLVVSPPSLRLIVLSLFLWWGLAHQARPFLLLPPPSSGGGVSSDGGVSPVSVPDSELSLSVCGDSSAASTVLNSQGYIVSNGDNAIKNANDIDNASSKVSNSNVSCGNASSNVSDSAICTASSTSNAINVNKLDNVASNAKTGSDNGPKSCSSADLHSNVLGEPVSDASVEVSPSSSVDAEMVPASNHRKRSAPEPPLEDTAAPPGFSSGSTSSEPGNSKISKKALRPPGCHSLPASVSLAARTASSRGPLS